MPCNGMLRSAINAAKSVTWVCVSFWLINSFICFDISPLNPPKGDFGLIQLFLLYQYCESQVLRRKYQDVRLDSKRVNKKRHQQKQGNNKNEEESQTSYAGITRIRF